MNITPNYNVNYLKYSSKISNNDGQSEPKELNQPAFKMNAKTASAASAAITAAVAGGIQAAKNLNKPTEEVPTKEEFEKLLKTHTKLQEYERKPWLNAYDISPEKTFAFYNLMDNEGNRYIDDEGYYTIDEFAEEGNKIFNNPQLVKEIVDIEDKSGVKPFDFDKAMQVTYDVADYQDGFRTMMSIKDKNGDFRFSNIHEDFKHAQIYEEQPELAIKYATMINEFGYPRFSADQINRLVELNKEYDSKDIDSALELKRNDGSYIFDHAPVEDAMYALKENPKEFIELCNLRIPKRERYMQPRYSTNTRTLLAYKEYPEATKTLLQMPHPDIYNTTRFDQEDINIYVAKAYNKAPKSFTALSKIRDKEGKLRFSAYDISEFLSDLEELDKETLKAINGLAKIDYLKDGKWQRWKNLDNNQIKEGIEAYKAYPKETKYIIQHYLRTSPEYKQEPYVPNINQVERFINNRKEFEFGLTKVEL